MATATSKGRTPAKATRKPAAKATPPAPREPTVSERFAGWPEKGYDGPQPWAFDELGLDTRPGEPDVVPPVSIDHARPILTSGSGGEHVREVAQRLAALGYATSISRGENPFDTLDETVLQAVEHFRQEHNVRECPGPFGGDTNAGRELAAAHVGPYTWAALIRASDRAR